MPAGGIARRLNQWRRSPDPGRRGYRHRRHRRRRGIPSRSTAGTDPRCMAPQTDTWPPAALRSYASHKPGIDVGGRVNEGHPCCRCHYPQQTDTLRGKCTRTSLAAPAGRWLRPPNPNGRLDPPKVFVVGCHDRGFELFGAIEKILNRLEISDGGIPCQRMGRRKITMDSGGANSATAAAAAWEIARLTRTCSSSESSTSVKTNLNSYLAISSSRFPASYR